MSLWTFVTFCPLVPSWGDFPFQTFLTPDKNFTRLKCFLLIDLCRLDRFLWDGEWWLEDFLSYLLQMYHCKKNAQWTKILTILSTLISFLKNTSDIAVLILIFNSAVKSPMMVSMFPDYALRHYSYLRDSIPDLVPDVPVRLLVWMSIIASQTYISVKAIYHVCKCSIVWMGTIEGCLLLQDSDCLKKWNHWDIFSSPEVFGDIF